jgi:hypothetical protein
MSLRAGLTDFSMFYVSTKRPHTYTHKNTSRNILEDKAQRQRDQKRNPFSMKITLTNLPGGGERRWESRSETALRNG